MCRILLHKLIVLVVSLKHLHAVKRFNIKSLVSVLVAETLTLL